MIARNPFQIVVLGFVTGLLVLLLASCGGGGGRADDGPNGDRRETATNRSNSGDDDWMTVFDDPSSRGERESGDSANRPNSERPWTIAIATFGSADHREISERFREEFVEVSGLTDAVVDRNESRSILHYGAYASPNDQQLERDLERIRSIEVEGRRPFARAFETVLATYDMGQYPQFNLINLRTRFSRDQTLYSLQIGFYSFESNKEREEAQKTAEDFVAQLRAEGEMAFYYHGQTKSHVCIGVFFEDDVDAITGYSRRVRQLQERYPYNLANGRQIIETHRKPSGEVVKYPQQSFLIAVPRD